MKNKDQGGNVVQMPGTEAKRRKYHYHVTAPDIRKVSTHDHVAAWLNAADAEGWEFMGCGTAGQVGPALYCWMFRKPIGHDSAPKNR